MHRRYSLTDATCVTADRTISHCSLQVDGKRIPSLSASSRRAYHLGDDYLVFPGLVNVHDHLRGDYLPRVGPSDSQYYLNWSFWDADLKSSPTYSERAGISVEDCYSLGAYKNLFSGVVTVNDHFPHEQNDPYLPGLPVRAIREYTLAHECSSFDLKWGSGIEQEHQWAVERNHPFITHLEEGFDAESQAGVDILETLGCLDDHALLIHCIGFSDEDIQKVANAGAHVAWCPASNMFMFNVTCKIKKILEAGIPVSIGTDSTHTGSVNLLEEVRFARETYRQLYGEDLPAKTLVSMITENPARAFRMHPSIGGLAEGMTADILVLRRSLDDPYESLVQAEFGDIVLLVRDGSPILGRPEYEELFVDRGVEYTRGVLDGSPILVAGDPFALLNRVRAAVGFEKQLDYMPLDRRD